MQFYLHRMFNVSALRLDDALKSRKSCFLLYHVTPSVVQRLAVGLFSRNYHLQAPLTGVIVISLSQQSPRLRRALPAVFWCGFTSSSDETAFSRASDRQRATLPTDRPWTFST